jgi:hypothetical protein
MRRILLHRPHRPLILSCLAAALLLAAVVSVATLLPATSTGGSVKLAPPVSSSPKPRVRVAGAYVHLANCQRALTGANGDDDIDRFIDSHTPYGIVAWAWDGSYRRSNTDIVVYVSFYNFSRRIGTGGGECWGDDSNISDAFTGW